MSAEANNPEGPALSVRRMQRRDRLRRSVAYLAGWYHHRISELLEEKNGTARAHPSESIGCSGAL
jgi:hypothetical protein